MSTKSTPTEAQEKSINKLLSMVDTMQEILSEMDILPESQIEWNNAIYDEVQVGFFCKTPDSTYQEDLAKEGFTMSFEEAMKGLLVRIHNMSTPQETTPQESTLAQRQYLLEDLSGRGHKSTLSGDHINNNWDLSEEDNDGVTLQEFINGESENDKWETNDTRLTSL